MTSRVVSVGLLNSYIKQLLETDTLLSDIWVEGEVSEVFVSRAGHIYFTLRDSESQVKCVLFKGNAQRQRILPAQGDQVAIHGYSSLYEATGVLQFYVDVVEHAGAGLLALQFEQLRQRLESEGLFDKSRKRALPVFPRHIGVVTSEQGAVWHDIQTVLRRRYPLTHLILAPTAVQGSAAPAAIVRALEQVQADGRADLVIVARGGGSAEDLACFNDERVARAVFACKVPVISAIGHETDWTIIDLVADVRAPTPSAAAELCSPSREALNADIGALRARAAACIDQELRAPRAALAQLQQRLERQDPSAVISRRREEIARYAGVIRHSRDHAIGERRAIVAALAGSVDAKKMFIVAPRRLEAQVLHRAIAAHTKLTVAQNASRVETSSAVLRALNPTAALKRGFAVIESESGALVTTTRQLAAGDRIVARFSDGTAGAIVDRVDASGGVRHNDGH